MTFGNNTLDYEIFLDAAHTKPWHDGFSVFPFTQTFRLDAVGNGAAQINTAFGEARSTSNLTPGEYSDTVIVSLNF